MYGYAYAHVYVHVLAMNTDDAYSSVLVPVEADVVLVLVVGGRHLLHHTEG